jgi:PPOX class probable F420-dependent enzyme
MDLSEGLTQARSLVAKEHGLVTVATTRPDGTVQASVVNAGILDHPLRREPVVGLVARGGATKLRNLRARPTVTVVFRAGWEWMTIEGEAELAGPDDPLPSLDADGVRLLLRDIFTAAGGAHEDFDEYDRVMAAEHRTAILIRPTRAYSN